MHMHAHIHMYVHAYARVHVFQAMVAKKAAKTTQTQTPALGIKILWICIIAGALDRYVKLNIYLHTNIQRYG